MGLPSDNSPKSSRLKIRCKIRETKSLPLRVSLPLDASNGSFPLGFEDRCIE